MEWSWWWTALPLPAGQRTGGWRGGEGLLAVWRLTSGDIDQTTPHHTTPAEGIAREISGWGKTNNMYVQGDRVTPVSGTVNRILLQTCTRFFIT